MSTLVSCLLELKEHCKKNASFETGLQGGDKGSGPPLCVHEKEQPST